MNVDNMTDEEFIDGQDQECDFPKYTTDNPYKETIE